MRLKNRFAIGFIPGLLLPLLGFYFYYLIFFGYMTFDQFIDHVLKANTAISVLSLGTILNLLLFFLFYVNETDHAARGVIGATLVYAFIVFYFKVVV